MIWSFILSASLFLFANHTANGDVESDFEWNITKTKWTVSDEDRYSDFVANLGNANCKSFSECLKSTANPYRFSDPAKVNYFSDCADLPYNLRLYFAWKNGLPFSYASKMKARPSSTPQSNIRYTINGNSVASRMSIFHVDEHSTINALKILNSIGNQISSAMFRIPAVPGTAEPISDFFSVKLETKAIRPGTVIYDVNGHVAVVYRVGADGRIHYMDAHPDNSLTRGVYGKKFARSRPSQGAGFKNFRPIELVGAKWDETKQRWIGGKIGLVPDSRLEDFSTEQFFGNMPDPKGDWSKGQFKLQGQVLPYYDYLRAKLSNGNLSFDPLVEFKEFVVWNL